MKIYTRSGDRGMTVLMGGTRVPKNHPRLEACGTVDEVVSWTGLIRDALLVDGWDEGVTDGLLWIQDRLMTASAILAREEGKEASLPKLSAGDTERLEQEIDAMEKELPALRSFIIPGGHSISSYCHICRSICRKSERLAVAFLKEHEEIEAVVVFLNRLGDYLFVLARHIARISGAGEIKWNA